MKRSEHIKCAEYVAEQTYYQEMRRFGIQRTPISDFLASKAIKWIGENVGTLPDKLEPALGKYHRGIFHSVDTYKIIETVKSKIRSQDEDGWWWKIFLLMCLTAYQSHIMLDSTTPTGIPNYADSIKLIRSIASKSIIEYES